MLRIDIQDHPDPEWDERLLQTDFGIYNQISEYGIDIKTRLKSKILFIKFYDEEFNKDPSGIYNQVLKFLGLPPHELLVYEKIRKRKYEKMNPETRKKLLEYFKPLNEKLYEYLGKNFHWNI